MARTADVQRSIWTADDDFIDLSPDAKLLYLWSFTNAHCNTAGLYRLAERVMRHESTLDTDRFEAAFAELREASFLVYEDKVLWVRTYWKHYRTRSHPNAVKGVLKDLRELGDHPLVAQFVARYEGSIKGVEGSTEFLSRKRKQEGSSTPSKGVRATHTGKEGGAGETETVVEAPSPADLNLPANLHPAFRAVWPLLLEVAKAKKAKLKPEAVANSIARHMDRDPIDVAERFRYWHLHGNGENKPLRNAAQGYDQFLRTSKTVAAVRPAPEPVDDTDERLAEAYGQ